MAVLLTQGKTVVARCSSKKTAVKYLRYRHSADATYQFANALNLDGSRMLIVTSGPVVTNYRLYSVHKWPERAKKG